MMFEGNRRTMDVTDSILPSSWKILPTWKIRPCSSAFDTTSMVKSIGTVTATSTFKSISRRSLWKSSKGRRGMESSLPVHCRVADHHHPHRLVCHDQRQLVSTNSPAISAPSHSLQRKLHSPIHLYGSETRRRILLLVDEKHQLKPLATATTSVLRSPLPFRLPAPQWVIVSFLSQRKRTPPSPLNQQSGQPSSQGHCLGLPPRIAPQHPRRMLQLQLQQHRL